MVVEVINILSAILAIGATIYLFVTANKTEKGLKGGLRLIGVGTLIALALHSISEALEIYGYITAEILQTIMPILVLIGSVLLIIGTYKIYQVINVASKE